MVKKISVSEPKIRERAIVIGGSISGLLSARVLANYFTKVFIVEKDTLAKQPQARIGVPQSVQPHVLFAKGYRILEFFFPGIGIRLAEKGALQIDWTREFYSFNKTGWYATSPEFSEIISFTCSRPLLEFVIRQYILEIDNIEILEETRVNNLIYDSNNNKVTGVKLNSQENNILSAQLVLDASGRTSNATKWLKNIGFNPPQETIIDPLLGYATCRYQEPKNFQANWKIVLINQIPPYQTRLGYIAKIENEEWIATLGGYAGDFPPLDREGFLDFSKTLSNNKFYQLISKAKPISDIYSHKATKNRLRHYEKINLPQGFIAIGDAVCALCPVYGQGMTVSAMSAKVLEKWLEDSINTSKLISTDFQKKLAKNNSFAWTLATSNDSYFPTTKGKLTPTKIKSLLQKYTNKLNVAATKDPEISKLLIKVSQGIKSPLSVYQPSVILKVLTLIK